VTVKRHKSTRVRFLFIFKVKTCVNHSWSVLVMISTHRSPWVKAAMASCTSQTLPLHFELCTLWSILTLTASRTIAASAIVPSVSWWTSRTQTFQSSSLVRHPVLILLLLLLHPLNILTLLPRHPLDTLLLHPLLPITIKWNDVLQYCTK
jgi:hypothetical protein